MLIPVSFCTGVSSDLIVETSQLIEAEGSVPVPVPAARGWGMSKVIGEVSSAVGGAWQGMSVTAVRQAELLAVLTGQPHSGR
ncbi:hypothetical protein OG426_09820 [Streptomyces canus]|uniref:hypothetical protein n=1 Tax=Streptomyces canus TaxID=58343 RepID=UPI0038702B40|nr:hypothetical protein OG426_09820 [Streptomyces canus]